MTHVLIFKDTLPSEDSLEDVIPRIFLGSCIGSKEFDLDPELSARVQLMLIEILDQPLDDPTQEVNEDGKDEN